SVEDDQLRSKLQRDVQKQSHLFWNALNLWLDDTEHALGRPTAFAFDYRAHVGIPISQALVKEHDRERLREVFHDYRLSPGQQLSLHEVTEFLEDWLPASHVSRALKHLWSQAEAKRQIASIAKLELELWDGSAPATEDGAGHETPLLIVAALREHPM